MAKRPRTRAPDDNDDEPTTDDFSSRPIAQASGEEEVSISQMGTKAVHCTKVLIPNKKAGSVIGKGGSVIKFIREKAACRVNVESQTPGIDTRTVSLVGGVKEICDGFDLVLRFLLGADGPGGIESSGVQVPAIDHFIETEIRLLVPGGKVGGLIGRGGEVIKALREETGCCIQIESSAMAGAEPERTVSLRGSLQALVTAHQRCLLKLAMVEERRLPQPPHPLTGGAAPSAAARPYRTGPPGEMAMPQSRPYRPDDGNQQAMQVQIPNEMIGKVIGRGGEVIREIRGRTAARIDIAPSDGGAMRLVTITGSPQQQQMAQYLMSVSMSGGSVAEALDKAALGGGPGGGAYSSRY